jgi:hypothetical protein
VKLALSIDGFPYLLATAGVTALPTPASGYASEWSSAWTLAQGFLDTSNGVRWEERMAPVEGSLDVGGMNFVVHDGKIATGPAAGQHLFSYMATRSKSVMTRTVLASSLAAGAVSVVVADGSSFPAGAQVIWVAGEAILCDSRASNTFTVNASGRGYYGSRDEAHDVDADASTFPAVYASAPGVGRRRCVLWHVDAATNEATPVWRGRLENGAPRLHSDGARFELPAAHVARSELDRTLGDPQGVCRLRGFNRHGVMFGLGLEQTPAGWHTLRSSFTGLTAVFRTYREAVDQARLELDRELSSPTYAAVAMTQFDATFTTRAMRLRVQTTGSSFLGAVIRLGSDTRSGISQSTADPRQVTVDFDPLPEVIVPVRTDTEVAVPVDSVVGMPSSWAASTYADGGYATTIRPVLRGEYDEDTWLVLVPTAHSADDATISSRGPTVAARAEFRPRGAGQPSRPFGFYGAFGYVTEAVRLRSGIQVETGHWVYGLQHAFEYTSLRSGHDARNWTWTNADALAGVVGGGALPRRTWVFDGGRKVRDVLAGVLGLHGCGLAVRAGGKLAPVAFRRALANETPAVALTGADLAKDRRQSWQVFRDGLANVAKVATDRVTLTVREAGSIGEYGEGRTVELELDGIPLDEALLSNYRRFASTICSRILYLWNEPIATVTLPLNLSKLHSVYLGDVVTLADEALLPNGIGGRGIGSAAALAALGVSAQYGFVFAREVDLTAGVVTLGVMLFPTSVGYSPTVRVQSSPSATTVTVSTAWINGADHTGANSADGGAARFAVGDRVELVLRDSTTHATESHIIKTIVGTTIEMQAAIDAAIRTAINVSGAWYELRYDDYATAGLQSNQERYAWCSDANDIGGSGDRPQEWAP